MLRFGTTRPGWIGVTAKPVSGNDEESEVIVEGLAYGSPAIESGLKVGDTLLRVNNTLIHRFGDLRDASFYLTADELVPITVERDGKEVTVSVRAADPPGESLALPPLGGSQGSSPSLTLPIPRDGK